MWSRQDVRQIKNAECWHAGRSAASATTTPLMAVYMLFTLPLGYQPSLGRQHIRMSDTWRENWECGPIRFFSSKDLKWHTVALIPFEPVINTYRMLFFAHTHRLDTVCLCCLYVHFLTACLRLLFKATHIRYLYLHLLKLCWHLRQLARVQAVCGYQPEKKKKARSES